MRHWHGIREQNKKLIAWVLYWCSKILNFATVNTFGEQPGNFRFKTQTSLLHKEKNQN